MAIFYHCYHWFKRTFRLFHNVEEEPTIGDSVYCEEVMETTISQIEPKLIEGLKLKGKKRRKRKRNQSKNTIQLSSESQKNNKGNTIVKAANTIKTVKTLQSFTENLNNLKLSTEVNQVNEVEVAKEECIAIEEKIIRDKVCWIEVMENEDYRVCPKSIIVKKVKKEEDPKLYEGIQCKGKKEKNRKRNQLKDTIQQSSEPQNNNRVNTIVKAAKEKHEIVEEDCASAHYVDTNDSPNPIYDYDSSDIICEQGSSFSRELRIVSDFVEEINYKFLVPINLVGAIISKKGVFVKHIENKTNIRLFIDNKTDRAEGKFKICTMIGSEININKALEYIRIKFPERAYPELKLNCITPLVNESNIVFQFFKSELIEGINNHVFISEIITLDRLILHNASGIDYMWLYSFNHSMYDIYTINKYTIPEVDLRTVSHGSVVAVYIDENWYRAQIIDVDKKKFKSATVFFLDYGGFKKINQCDIKIMHKSLMSYRFQAIECGLANIAPAHGEWSDESMKIFETLTTNKMLFAQVIYNSDSIPFINLLASDGSNTISINDELIKYGFAVYVSTNGVFQMESTQENEIELTHSTA